MNMLALRWLAFALPVFVASQTTSTSQPCNNSPDLCDRSYSSITHLGAHDSPFLRDASTNFSDSGNQNVNTTAQLAAGVRLLTVQVHKNEGAWHLCHTSCNLLDAGLLSDWLAEIKTWMDANPRDVVTIILVNSDNASSTELEAEFAKSKIDQYAYTPPSSTSLTTWPTLQDLITKSTRLITFVASLDTSTTTSPSYLLDEFTHIFENPFQVTSLANFSCLPERPPALVGDISAAIKSGRMPLLNHFKDIEAGFFDIITPDISNITTTNAASGAVGNLGDAATECTTVYGRAPTFILVDFFNQANAIETVDRLNNISGSAIVGRSAVPNTPIKDSNGAGRRGINTEMSGLLTRWRGCAGVMFVVGVSFALL